MNSADHSRQTGRVVRVESGLAWVQPRVLAACGACGVRKTCGSGALAAWAGRRLEPVPLVNHLNARPGDQVALGVSDATLIRAALLAYFLPLLTTLLLALSAAGLGLAEGRVMLASAAGLVLGLLLARYLGARRPERQGPHMLEILAPDLAGRHPQTHFKPDPGARP